MCGDHYMTYHKCKKDMVRFSVIKTKYKVEAQ